jgi:hypothetical protein
MAEQNVADGLGLTRQINFFVMRYMWQLIRKRGSTTIYDALKISRTTYTRIIDTGQIKFTKAKLGSLNQTTGLREEIFTGALRFECSYVKIENGEEKKYSIQEKEWENLFKWRLDRKKTKDPKNQIAETELDEIKNNSIQNSIYGKLKSVYEYNKGNKENWDLYRLCYYLKESEPAPLKPADVTARDILGDLDELTFDVLSRCDIGMLKKLEISLKKKYEVVKSIRIYKDLQKTSK